MAVKKKDSARLAKRLGGNLSERRKQLRWTQEMVAERVGARLSGAPDQQVVVGPRRLRRHAADQSDGLHRASRPSAVEPSDVVRPGFYAPGSG